MNAPTTHYETLGVPRDATAADIKRAYFKLVRTHSPENDPDGFQRISEAYRVLSDPEARKAYDTDVPIPPGVRAVLERASSLVESEPEKAVAEARRVVAVKGVPVAARVAAAQILLRAGKPAEAVAVAKQIVREAPQIVEHQVLLGTALRAQGEKQAALETSERAVALGPWHLGAWLLLGDCAMDVGGRPKALAVMDKALASRRFEPLESIPLRIRKFAILAGDREWPAMERVVAEVAACVPKGDDAAARHVAWEWTKLGEQARDAKLPDVAVAAFDAALALAEHPGLRAERDRLAPDAGFLRESCLAMEDRDLPEWLRSYVRLVVAGPTSQTEGQRTIERIARAIQTDAKRTAASWDAMAEDYPAVDRKLGREWRKFHRSAAPKMSKGAAWGIMASGAAFILFLAYKAATQEKPRLPSPQEQTRQYIEKLANDPAIMETLKLERDVVRKVIAAKGATAAEIPLTKSERVILTMTDEWAIRGTISILPMPEAEKPRAVERVLEIRRQLIAAPR